VKVLVTGAAGFIGKNVSIRLEELGHTVLRFNREGKLSELKIVMSDVDACIHLAGENRPENPNDFEKVNVGLTESVCDAIRNSGRLIPLLLASSSQAGKDNPYARSKLAAETMVRKLSSETQNPVIIYRLPNVFGKWCKPNYNSAVATFCNNIANDLPIQVNDASTVLTLVYIDDVVDGFIDALKIESSIDVKLNKIEPQHQITLGDLVSQIKTFKMSRDNLISERVGEGFVKALYSTYLSYLPTNDFSYPIASHSDERGVFVEMLKTKDSGQFSYFTAGPGITRGEHYHHTKTEKFLVIRGTASFGFRQIITNEKYELIISSEQPTVVDTVPGWTHDITNIGEDELIVMLWANEVFDPENPDTKAAKV
jgi:UDP-2-acetamido-2,6-beta-L-arabino-hexul-4-ose reductase